MQYCKAFQVVSEERSDTFFRWISFNVQRIDQVMYQRVSPELLALLLEFRVNVQSIHHVAFFGLPAYLTGKCEWVGICGDKSVEGTNLYMILELIAIFKLFHSDEIA